MTAWAARFVQSSYTLSHCAGVLSHGLCLAHRQATSPATLAFWRHLLNEDFDYYLSIVGERTKKVGLGTFGDGADRCRPMLIFANPLGCPELERSPVLVHRSEAITSVMGKLVHIGTIKRTCKGGGIRMFYCYGCPGDYDAGNKAFDLVDPLPMPKRKRKTQPRGKFRLSISTAG